MNEYPAAFHAHWLEVLRHTYRCAPHASVGELESWSAFTWKTKDARQALLLPRPHGAEYLVEQALAFIQTAGWDPKEWLVETANDRDQRLETFLFKKGWEPKYQLPGWMLSKEAWAAWEEPTFPDDGVKYTVAVAGTDDVRKDFGIVQGLAYEETYGVPAVSQMAFWKNAESINTPHAKGWVVYADDVPVRTVALFLFEGVASVGAGACIPGWRGKHLGLPLIWNALGEGLRAGADVCFGVTMPSGVAVALRMGALPILNYTRWGIAA